MSDSSADDRQPTTLSQRVLMICYYFPPILASGVARSVGFAKQLPGLRWSPHVLTVRKAKESWESSVKSPVPEGIEISRTTELGLPGLFDFLQGVVNRVYRLFSGRDLEEPVVRRALGFPDAHIGWLILRRASKLARNSDCVYVSCKPYSAAVLAILVKKLTGKPLVVDFRDPWTAYLHSRRDKWLERKVVHHCDRLILNTDESLAWYAEAYPDYAQKMSAIPNGFDKPIYPIRDATEETTITIVHVGSFYLDRKPDVLLEAMVKLNDLRLKFVQVGDSIAVFDAYKDRLNIEVTGKLPPEKAFDFMARADILYLKQGISIKECIAAKTYEYLTTGRPILAECAESADAGIIARYAPVAEIVHEPTTDNVLAALRSLVAVAKTSDSPPNEEYLARYNRANLTKRLALTFDELCAGQDDKPAA